MTSRVWLVRHGESLMNALGRVQGWADAPLTPAGLAQAEERGREFAAAGVVFDAAVSADGVRHRETLRGILGDAAVPVTEDVRWRELYFGPSKATLPPELLRRVAAALDAGMALSAPSTTFDELLASIPAARLLARQVARGEVRHVDDRPLTRLIAQLHGDQRMQEHSERMLEPLIRHDLATDGDLVRVLRAVVAHPGNRTAAASASHLSRSVFYQRLALISDLLGADLDDGETLAALHLAVLARGRRSHQHRVRRRQHRQAWGKASPNRTMPSPWKRESDGHDKDRIAVSAPHSALSHARERAQGSTATRARHVDQAVHPPRNHQRVSLAGRYVVPAAGPGGKGSLATQVTSLVLRPFTYCE